MQVVFVRHGEPTYEYVTQRGFMGHGRDLSQLTPLGKEQARKAAQDPQLADVECILSSPYTRALQTASILSRCLDVDIEVELDLHEWLPDLTYTYTDSEYAGRAESLCNAHRGACPTDSPIRYEESQSVFCRAKAVLEKYREHGKIAVVAHGFLIREFVGTLIPHCGVSTVEFTADYTSRSFGELQKV